MSANVVFINIDWKSSRMNRTLETNMKILAKTIAGVVHNMKPTMICMSEVGVTKHPLSEEQMQQMANQCISTWKDAATEHIQLRSMFSTGAPYMTIYIDGPIRCSNHRILHDLYYAGGQARTAQTFVCSFPGGGSADVVNVHAPSGSKSLQDSQRQTLLTNLLQSNSLARPGCTIGNAHFLIGGDMNTAPFLMAELLHACRDNGSLRTEARTHEREFAKHGDLCVVAGVQASTLTTKAQNHDPQHDPYGVCCYMPQRSATEQPSSFKPATKQRAAPSSGYATEQSLPALTSQAPWRCHQTASSSEHATQPPWPAPPKTAPTPETTVPGSVWNGPRAAPASGSATEQHLPAPPAPPPTLEPAMQARLELENLEKRAEQSELTDRDIERALEGIHAKRGDILKPEDFLQESQEDATAAAAAAAATEHSEETSNLPAEKQLIYSIVNAFLNKITFHHPQAEELLVAALQDETCLAPSIHLRVKEVFAPIFFHYPNGLKDRSVWEPRDTNKYIRQWYELASMREWLTPDAAATEHGNELSKAQVSQIFKWYMEDMSDTAVASDSQILYEPWYPCPGCIGRMPTYA